jgi:hypothetical protein
MNTPTLRSLWLPAVLLVAPLLATACVDEVDQDSPAGELLFNLSEDDVQLIHDEYLAGEDYELTLARLSAPFDCSLYAGLCAQVGRDAAIVLTERQVEQALAGVPVDEISAETQAGITEASEIRRAIEAAQPDDESDDESEDVFRSSGPWAIRTKGDYRLKVRNHASHPLIGDITAWTESKLQHRDWLGIWWAVDGTEICVNTGTNDLESGYLGVQINGQYYYFLDESKDPNKHCIVGQSSHERSTTHARLESVHGYTLSWRLTARGCGTGLVNGITLGICAEDHDITWITN